VFDNKYDSPLASVATSPISAVRKAAAGSGFLSNTVSSTAFATLLKIKRLLEGKIIRELYCGAARH
jgi:hypothetical protein